MNCSATAQIVPRGYTYIESFCSVVTPCVTFHSRFSQQYILVQKELLYVRIIVLLCRYWLIETRNPDNVTSDARLLYRKLSAVPYLAKFVVYAKVSLDGKEARLRVFCVTDDKVDKTLECQTGYVEIARSRDVEVCEGRPVYIK